MPDLKAALAEGLTAHFLRAEDPVRRIGTCGTDCDWSGGYSNHPAHLADVLLALPGVAVIQLPDRPSEYWGPEHQPQWNHYPFTRVDGDEIEIGARSEHVYRVNVAEARIHAADLLAAIGVVESATEVGP